MVMPQGDPEPGAHIGQPGRANVPDLPGNPHSADEWERDGWQTVGRAAAAQHVAVERCVVRSQEPNFPHPLLNLGPDLGEGRRRTDIRPRQTVYAGEAELPRGRPYQLIETLDNSATGHDDDPQRARAVGARVRRLEVDRREPIVPRMR